MNPSDWVGLVKYIGEISDYISYRYSLVSKSSLTKDFSMTTIS